jgi:hypothetical protein
VVVFASNDMVPRVARLGAHQRFLKFLSTNPKILLQQNPPRAEVAPHSITSSASVSTFGGTAIPSCFAVLRFTTNQNLLAYLIGRSPGFARPADWPDRRARGPDRDQATPDASRILRLRRLEHPAL